MAMFFTKEKLIFEQWKFNGDLLTFSEPSSFWISLIVSLGMHTFAFNCFKMTKLTSFRQHLFEDDRQTFTAVFISLKIFIITSLSKICSMCYERKHNYTEGRNNCCDPCFFFTALIFDPPRKRQNRCHYEMFKLTQQTIVT